MLLPFEIAGMTQTHFMQSSFTMLLFKAEPSRSAQSAAGQLRA